MEDIKKMKGIIEAHLIVSESGLSAQDIKEAVEEADETDIIEAIELLQKECEETQRAYSISNIAGKYRIVTRPQYMPWISNLYQKEIERISGPSMETLAILAYKQPATRTEIESVRGVNVGGVLKALLDKGLVRVKGRKDIIGRPLIYETTEKFLELFGLNSLGDLPTLREFKEEDLEYGKTQEDDIVNIDHSEEEEELEDAGVSQEDTIPSENKNEITEETVDIDEDTSLAPEAEENAPEELPEYKNETEQDITGRGEDEAETEKAE